MFLFPALLYLDIYSGRLTNRQMKRTLIICVFNILTFNYIYSQNIYLSAGLSGSKVNLTYSDVPEFYDSFPILSPDLGICYEAPLSKTWSLLPGLYVNKQGIKMVSEPANGYYVDNKYIINYIEIPLLLAYNFRRKDKRDMFMSISAGPFFSYGYYGKFISSNSSFYEEENIFVGSDDLYRSNYGATVKYTAGFENHRLSAYFSAGMRNLGQEEGIFKTFRTMSFGIHYNFILATNTKKSGFVLKKMFY